LNFARVCEKIYALDISEKSLELARVRTLHENLNNITFIRANLENLNNMIPEKSCDLVYSFGVIHHTPNPEKVIEGIKKYMKPESEFRLMVYNKLSWKVLWILLRYGKGIFWKLDKLIAQNSEAQTGCPVTYTYTKKSIKKLLKDFDIISIQIEHIFPYSIPEYKRYEYKKMWYFRWMPLKLFRWLEHKLGWHLCITCKLKAL
jgi:ubiquinone/menaquinone biosynthesis C-methylase UbiE